MASQNTFSKQVTNVLSVVSETPVEAHFAVLVNTTAAIAYLQIFTQLYSGVTVGTTVPTYVIPVAANGSVILGMGGSNNSAGWRLGGQSCSVAATTTRGGAVSAPIDTLIGL